MTKPSLIPTMRIHPTLYFLLTLTLLSSVTWLHAEQPSNGLAPEVPGLNLKDKLYQLEAKLPDLEKAGIDDQITQDPGETRT